MFTKQNIKDIYRLSPIQEGIYFHAISGEGSSAYIGQTTYRLKGDIRPEEVRLGFNEIVGRHDVLRTVFTHKKSDDIIQIVLKERGSDFNFEDISMLSTSQQIEFLENFLTNDRERGFDLSKDCLIRISLFKIAKNEFEIIWTHHHIILDGWCIGIIISEFFEIYNSRLSGSPYTLATTSQYGNYIKWFEKQNLIEAKNYWKETLADFDKRSPIVPAYSSNFEKAYQNQETNLIFDENLSDRIREFAQSQKITLNNFLQGIWAILLKKYNDTEEVVFGKVVTIRPKEIANIENTLGLFINTVPQKISFKYSESVTDFLNRLQTQNISQEKYEYFSLSEILNQTQFKNNLFDHVFVFENFPTQKIVENPKRPIKEAISTISFSETNYAFNLVVLPEKSIRLIFNYNENRIEKPIIDRMARHFENLLNQIVENPSQDIKTLEVCSQLEKSDLLNISRGPRISYPQNNSIAEIFVQLADQNKQKLAIADTRDKFTYAQANQISDAIALRIMLSGVNPGEIVMASVERTAFLPIIILGIWKAGAVYLPIAPSLPHTRIETILKDSDAKLLISDNTKTLNYFRSQIKCLSNTEILEPHTSHISLRNQYSTDAYIIYTSGTTGTPKGVQISHKGIIDRVFYHNHCLEIEKNDNVLQFASQSFDASIIEIGMALLSGASLFIADDSTKNNIHVLSQFITEKEVSVAILPPAYIKILEQHSLPTLEKIITTGEAATLKETVFYAQTKRVFNGYGPTECCIGASFYEVSGNIEKYTYTQRIPIGKPFGNTDIYLLDSNLNLVSKGQVGEIYVSGVGNSKGYLNNPELTEKKFIKNPFSNEKGFENLYKTGDRGFWNEANELEFLGRLDDQVQINGIRVEPSEIENLLLSIPQVREATVVCYSENEKQVLAGAWCKRAPITNEKINQFLAERLPSYMLPTRLVEFESLPKNASGKANKVAIIEEIISKHQSNERIVEAQTAEEKVLIEVVSSLLSNERVSLTDNFLQVGGDSIKAIQLVSKMHRKGFTIDVKDVLAGKNFQQVSKSLIQTTQNSNSTLETGFVSLSPIQHKLFERGFEKAKSFTMNLVLETNKRFQAEKVKKVLGALQSQHDSLRLRFWEELGEIKQKYEETIDDIFIRENDIPDEINIEEFLRSEVAELESLIDLKQKSLLNVGLYHAKSNDYLIFVCHHLIVDGVSWRLLLADFNEAYQQLYQGKKIDLGNKPLSYKTYVNALNVEMSVQKELDYWKKNQDDESHKNKIYNNVLSTAKQLTKPQTNGILNLRKVGYGNTETEILLATLAKTLANSNSTFSVMLESHGRSQFTEKLDFSHTIGWFTSIFPQRFEISNEFYQDLQKIKEQLRSVPNGGIGYGYLKYISGYKFEEPNILFNYLGDIDSDKNDLGFDLVDLKNNKIKEQDYAIVINSWLENGAICISVNYDSTSYSSIEIESMINQWSKNISEVCEWGNSLSARMITPYDLTFKDISIKDLCELREKFAEKGKIIEDIYRLTPMQEGMLLEYISSPNTTAYIYQLSLKIKGKFNQKNFENAIRQIAIKHPVLRANISNDVLKSPVQVIVSNQSPKIDFEDISNETTEVQQTIIEDFKVYDSQKPINLFEDSMLRVKVFQLSSTEIQLFWTCHHIVLDGWSMNILLRDFYELYRSPSINFSEDNSANNFGSFIEKYYFQNEAKSLDFWESYLDNYNSNIVLPHKLLAESNKEYKTGIHRFELPDYLVAGLKDLALSQKTTLSTITQAIWGILLGRYNNSTDVVFGNVVSGRPPAFEGIDSTVGLFINTIPTRVSFNEKQSFIKILDNFQHQQLEALKHQHISLAEIQTKIASKRKLFDHILVFENYQNEEVGNVKDGNLEQIREVQTNEHTNYDLVIVISEKPTLTFKVQFNKNVYDYELISYIGKHFKQLVRGIVQDEEAAIRTNEIVSNGEKVKVLFEFNQLEEVSFYKENFVSAFEKIVKSNENKTAILYNHKEISYQKLNQESNKVVSFLKSKFDIKKGDFVAIYTDRTDYLFYLILGTMKLGATFIPIDKTYPTDRIEYMLNKCGAKILITDSHTIKFDKIVVIGWQNITNDFSETRTEDYQVNYDLNSLAYVLFTSGSTGKPKGVEIRNSSLMNYLNWANSYYYDGKQGFHMPLFTSVSFDLTITSLLCPLLRGDMVHIFDDYANLLNVIEDIFTNDSLKTVKLTPAHIQLIEYTTISKTEIEKVIVGGEELRQNHIEILKNLNPSIEIYNEYGPTEATVGCCIELVKNKNELITIGNPITNSKIFVLDSEQRLSAIGVIGEIYISGVGVAKGYINDDLLTDERFVNLKFPICKRAYKTGDLGCWLPNGKLFYAGRKDNQVKINGYRVEISEIEQQLDQISELSQFAVVVKTNDKNEPYLCCYAVRKDGQIKSEEIKKTLKKSLPFYMIPNQIIFKKHLPLTPNGKIDKESLVKLADEPNSNLQILAQTPEEFLLQDSIEQILGIQNVDLSIDFFQAGGNSIHAMQFLAKINKEGYDLSMQDLFESLNLKDFASLMANQIIKLQPVEEENQAYFEHISSDEISALQLLFN